MQLIDLGQEVEYIDIDVSKVPYTFSVKLSDKTYSFTIRYNDTGGFFTLDLSVTAKCLPTETPSATGGHCSAPLRMSAFLCRSSFPCASRGTMWTP